MKTAISHRLAWRERLLACFQQALGHELPNHFVALRGLAQLLLLEEPERLSPEGRDYLEHLNRLVHRCDTLVRQLAALGRVGRDSQLPAPVSLGRLLPEIAAELRHRFPHLTFAFELAPAAEDLTLPGSAGTEVVGRLLTFRVEGDPSGRPWQIRLSGERRGRHATIVVTDDGPSLPEDRLAGLFEPFRDASPDQELGLFPVRHLVESWGGSVTVAPVPGNAGCVFTLQVPVRPGSEDSGLTP